jgi:hypothetical protein
LPVQKVSNVKYRTCKSLTFNRQEIREIKEIRGTRLTIEIRGVAGIRRGRRKDTCTPSECPLRHLLLLYFSLLLSHPLVPYLTYK